MRYHTVRDTSKKVLAVEVAFSADGVSPTGAGAPDD
jgi:hypothetical protein